MYSLCAYIWSMYLLYIYMKYMYVFIICINKIYSLCAFVCYISIWFNIRGCPRPSPVMRALAGGAGVALRPPSIGGTGDGEFAWRGVCMTGIWPMVTGSLHDGEFAWRGKDMKPKICMCVYFWKICMFVYFCILINSHTDTYCCV